ncbi:xylose isomerase-like protein [Rhypophila decipiens]|uniref:Xylose isomerase-like protein n=1 Tax=Rhypophila decipiens TaxID=261697 RepID=A0AAN7B1Q3_9PEZI|nr:xylose isomerase-like protein [Rhypophila decipiens]
MSSPTHNTQASPPLDISQIPLAFASCSIGPPNSTKYTLHQKIEAIRNAGFNGIELSFPDLIAYAKLHFARESVDENDYPLLAEAAVAVRTLCDRHQITIMVLQPFSNFEGWAEGTAEREDAFRRAKGWIEIMKAGGIKMLQVGSTDSAEDKITDDKEKLAADLRQLADMLGEHGFKLAYENWCWATRAPYWKDVWEIVRLVDRENVGLCLDTFQTAGGEWGDPTTQSGLMTFDGGKEDLDRRYKQSLEELIRTVPAEKIFFLQISDAYKMDGALKDEENEDGLRPRGQWSHDWRPLPYDGGYLPIEEFAGAVLKTGFRGWVSVEVFDGKFEDKYNGDLVWFARDAMRETRKLLAKGLSH